LGRVDVLPAQWVVLVQFPRLEADDPSARVGQREHQPPLEVVRATPRDQPRPRELLGRELLLTRLLRERRARRREPEPELATDLPAAPARLEVLLPRFPRLGPQHALVERRRLVEQREQPVAPMPLRLGLRRRLLVLELDVEAVGEPLDGAHEVETL